MADDALDFALDGYIDLETGIVDVVLGGPGGESRDKDVDRRRLALMLLGRLATDESAISFLGSDIRALRAMGDFAEGWIGSRELAQAVLAALERYLSGEQEGE